MNAQELASLPHGTPLEGGFYAGLIRVLGDVFAVIAAPKADGERAAKWGPYGKDATGACSFFDGKANTLAMAEAGSELAQWALGLSIGGFADWHIPSRDELELLYRHLKPKAEHNWRYRGDNPSSVPVGYPYELEAPGQTAAALFREGGLEALETEWYWSSTQYSAIDAWYQSFVDGYQYVIDKNYEGRARAVRRLKVSH